MLPYLSLFGRTLPTYGVLAMAGAVLGLLLSLARCKRFGLSRDDCAYLYVFGALGVLAGAKILYLLPRLPGLVEDLPLIWREPALFYDRYIAGGLVFYGGVLGGVLGAWGAARYFRRRFADFFPVLVPVFPLAHAFGRLGCFCAGCCYGLPADPPLGIPFTWAVAGPNGVPLLPVQLWECGAELIITLFLVWYAGRKGPPERVLRAYLAAYAPVRFVLEFFRGDTARGLYGPLSTSQWISLAVLAIAALWAVWEKRRSVHARL